MVTIRLTRTGMKKLPFYRLVVADKRARRDGRFIEVVGHFDPRQPEAQADLKMDRIEHWLSKGAQPTESAHKLIRRAQKKPTAAA